MKRLLFIAFFVIFLVGCTKPPVVEEKDKFIVTFDSKGGSSIASIEVIDGDKVSLPEMPTKEGYTFVHWYLIDETLPYDFNLPITQALTLHALWEVELPSELTNDEKIWQDIAAVEAALMKSENELNLPIRGTVNRSTISWKSESQYISNAGIILPSKDASDMEGQIIGTFTLNGVSVTKTFNVPIPMIKPVVIEDVRTVPFKNVTTEYTVADGEVDLYFEAGGSVPYIEVLDFLNLLQGFIDPEVEFTITKTDSTLTIFYQYYDEDFDEIYDLSVVIDADENTLTTNDPGFYWAYVYTTETNYGRHISYVADHPDAYSIEGENVVYDLDDYAMDIVVYEGEIVLPYYIVNQLFAGSSYYNVYYNYDGLFGIYSLPRSGTPEYRAIKNSSMNNTKIPADLLVHTFNMLAFNFDYFYGLKDIMEVDSYYDLLYSQVNKLLNPKPEDFDYAIRGLLLKSIDEPHTSYGYPSYFNKSTWSGPEQNQLTYYGSRFQTWYYDGYIDVDDAIEAKWGTNPDGGWNAYGPNRPNYWFLDDVTVSLILDDFNTSDIEESSTYDSLLAENAIKSGDISAVLPAVVGGHKFFYYNLSDEKNDQLGILIKGLDESFITSYHDALIALGYEYIDETITDSEADGYYVITINEVNYMVQVVYDNELNLTYIGIMDSKPLIGSTAWPFKVNVMDTVIADSAVYLEMMFDQILAERPNIENVLLDLSWNTGGNVGALYRIVGFITDQPFGVSGIDRDTGGASTYYVQIDGVPNYSHLNWGVLITPLTFSAANQLATIFLENDLGPIIGVQSGGGACSITPILLPNGTAFTMSSNNINAYRTGLGTDEDPYVYNHNEFGIPPDVEIPIEDIYDAEVLLQIFQ